MLNKLTFYPKLLLLYYKFLVQISKSSQSSFSKFDEYDPISWEFSGFSQNCEDGIIGYLISRLKNSNKYFVEIGSSNGIENNTTYLAVVKKFSGIMIDGDKAASKLCSHLIKRFCIGVECLNLFVESDTIELLRKRMLYMNPDVFSLDIDGNDYYLARTILEAGIGPKIFVVEYNSTFGPEKELTIKYQNGFNVFEAHSSYLYYGVSISAWVKLFDDFGYKFITVDSNGVNAFFVNPLYFDENFLKNCKGLKFKENFYQLMKFKKSWEEQFDIISNQDFNEFKK
jgi:hypothetical protein